MIQAMNTDWQQECLLRVLSMVWCTFRGLLQKKSHPSGWFFVILTDAIEPGRMGMKPAPGRRAVTP